MIEKIKINFQSLRDLADVLKDEEIDVDRTSSCCVSKARSQFDVKLARLSKLLAQALDQCEVTFPNGDIRSLKAVISYYPISIGVSSLGKFLVEQSEVNNIPTPEIYVGTETDKTIERIIKDGTPIKKLSLLNVQQLPKKYYRGALSGGNSVKHYHPYVTYSSRESLYLNENDFDLLTPLAQLRISHAFKHVTISKKQLEMLMMTCMFAEKDLVEDIKRKFKDILK